MIRVVFGMIACALAAAAAPPDSSIEEDPRAKPILERLTEAERAHRQEIVAVVADVIHRRPVAVERLRSLLSKLEPGSATSSFVTGVLLGRLREEARMEELLATAESAIRAQPADFLTKFAAIRELASSPYYVQAADYWLEMAHQIPEFAVKVNTYATVQLIERLNAADDKATAGEIARRLFLGGYDWGSASELSIVAATAFREFVEAGERENALRALDSITDPGDLLAIMVDREYADYWEQAERSGGPDLSHAYRRHLAGLKAHYREKDDLFAASRLMSIANEIGLHEQVLARFLPIYEEAIAGLDPKPRGPQYQYVFWVSPLARAHLAAGDNEAAERLYEKAGQIWGEDGASMAFNVAANRADMYHSLGRYEEAAELMGEVIAGANANRDVSEGALASMHRARIAALAELGRLDQAEDSIRFVDELRDRFPVYYARTLVDQGLEDEAVEHLVRALESENYESVLFFMQPDLLPPRTDYQRRAKERYDALRQNEKLRAAFERRGRILDLEAPEGVTL